MNFTYGYCRISTPKQSIERQIRNIKEKYPNAKIIQEKYSGTKADRPKWNRLLKSVRSGDTIVFDSVSRMSRNAKDGINTYFDLYEKGINLVFLKEHYVDTDVYRNALSHQVPDTNDDVANIYIDAANKALRYSAEQQIRMAFEQAQKEIDDLHQNTREGIETARRNDKKIGRPVGQPIVTKKKKAAKAKMLEVNRTFGNGNLSDKDTIDLLHISRPTFYRYKKELKKEYPELVVRP